MSIYDDLDVRTIINVTGASTRVGGALTNLATTSFTPVRHEADWIFGVKLALLTDRQSHPPRDTLPHVVFLNIESSFPAS